MNETLVSILPLVENRDEWKRRALMAEAKLAELAQPKGPTNLPPFETVSATRNTCATVGGSRGDVLGIMRDAALDLVSAMMEARVIVPKVVKGELRLTCYALQHSEALTEGRLAQVVAEMTQG